MTAELLKIENMGGPDEGRFDKNKIEGKELVGPFLETPHDGNELGKSL